MKVSALIVLRDIPEIILVYKNLVQESQDDLLQSSQSDQPTTATYNGIAALRSLNNLGYWYRRNGQHDEAVDCWKRCLSVDPKLWSPNASLGMRAKSDNDTATATKFFKTSLKTCPDKARPIILEENMKNKNLIF